MQNKKTEGEMTNIIQLPVIAGVEITTDAEGRFNLNALHRASGAEKKNGASYWLATDSAKALVDVINSKTTGISVVTVEGRNGGTFAVEQLAVAYANWISPEFYLQVINTFLDSKKAASNIAVPTSLAEALQLAANIERDRVQALIERDEAIRTKAQIGSSREASAMADYIAAARPNQLKNVLNQINEFQRPTLIRTGGNWIMKEKKA